MFPWSQILHLGPFEEPTLQSFHHHVTFRHIWPYNVDGPNMNKPQNSDTKTLSPPSKQLEIIFKNHRSVWMTHIYISLVAKMSFVFCIKS